jgi:hypothetical protein
MHREQALFFYAAARRDSSISHGVPSSQFAGSYHRVV